MTRLFTVLALIVCFATAAHAQQTQSLAWDYIGLTPAEVAAGTQAVQFNGSAITTAPTCTAKTTAPTGTSCTVPLPALQPTNSASVSLTRSGTTSTTTINGITTSAAASASSPRLTINVTINLGS